MQRNEVLKPDRGPQDPNNDNLSKVGYNMFVLASRTCPNSVTAQGALIALNCILNELNPSSLSSALLSDEPRIQSIINIANMQHTTLGKGPIVNSEMVLAIIKSDFALATYFLKGDSVLLQRIGGGDLYDKLFRSSKLQGEQREKAFNEQVIKILLLDSPQIDLPAYKMLSNGG